MGRSHRILELTGPARARGRAHGEALREPIRDLLRAWEEEVGLQVGLPLGAYVDRFTRDTDHLRALERHAPALLEEIRGIAEGGGIPLRECLVLQCMDERWTHIEAPSASGGACSTIALARAPGSPALLAQNVDLPSYLDGFQVLLHLVEPETALELLVPSFPGFLGLAGLSSRGLAVGVNTLAQLRPSPAGLPVAAVVRGILECADPRSAERFVRSVPHASGQCYLVASAGGAVALECSAGGVAALSPQSDGAICHTNHPLASADLREDHRGWCDDRERADAEHGRTFTRLETLRRGAQGGGVSDLQALLADVPGGVCRPRDGPLPVFTFCGLVAELGEEPCLHFAPGPPDSAPWRRLGFHSGGRA